MKILVLHHVEEMWLPAHLDSTLELLTNVIKHVKRSSYDKVILSTLDGDISGFPCIDKLATEIVEWAYGWEHPDHYEMEEYELGIETFHKPANECLIPVSSHHQWALVYSWIEQLKGHQVSVCGGHREECLLDLCETLEHLGIKYKKIEKCIYG